MALFIIYFLFKTFLVVECQDNVPEIYYSCASDGLLVTASFPKPFHGTIFAKDYLAVPKCSTPNMAASITQEVQLNLPLLKCGTKVRRRNRNRFLVETTITIQYHPILTTIFDYSVNITCKLQGRLPSVFWDLYRQRQQPKTKYDSWVEFKLGNKVFGEKESQMLGVSHKLFLLVYVNDGGKNKHAVVDKCIAHKTEKVNEETPVAVLSKTERCPADSLNEFSLVANSSVSDLVAFAEVQPINISLVGGFYITCALELCKEVCVQPCQYGMETSRWSTISTHKIEKRSLEIPNQEVFKTGTKKSLKSSLQDLAKKLKKLRLLQIARRKGNELVKSKETEISTGTPLTSSEEIFTTVLTLPKLIRQGRVYSLKLDIPSEDFKSVNLTEETSINVTEEALVNLTEKTSNATPESSSNDATDCSNCMPTTVVNASAEEDSYNRTQTSAPQIVTLYPQVLLPNTSTTVNTSINNLDTFEEYVNSTEQYSNITSNCVPRFKFISVTASLSFLTVCFFLICVGLILHLRKERKKHLLDSYLLYNFF